MPVLAAGPAQADPRPPDLPSQAQVQRARAAAAAKAGQVMAVQHRLSGAAGRLNLLARNAGQAAEAYNGAVHRLRQATVEAAAATARTTKAERTVERQRRQVGLFAAGTFAGGNDLARIGMLFTADGPQDLLDAAGVARSVATAMQGAFQRYRAVEAVHDAFSVQAEASRTRVQAAVGEAAAAKRRAGAAHRIQSVAVAAMTGERRRLIGQLAGLRRTSYQVAARRQQGLDELARQRAAAIAGRKAAELRRRIVANAAAEQRRRPAAHGTQGTNGPGAGGGRAAAAIGFARAQLGEPYVWGGAGPDSWDCSGLVMRAWQRAGAGLSHHSVAQYGQTRRLSAGQLRPGDLAFWATDPADPGTVYHVGLYVGGGQMIHAPRTGRPVSTESLYYSENPAFFGRVG